MFGKEKNYLEKKKKIQKFKRSHKDKFGNFVKILTCFLLHETVYSGIP